jgi:alcohol dehydrogenase
MRALVFDGDDDYELREVPRPGLEEPTDAVLEVRCAVSSGTDKHLFDDPAVEEGRVLGPEFVGVVDEVGPEVARFEVGDRVVPATMTHCGRCFYCDRGEWANCTDGGWEMGYTRDGGRAEYARIRYADENLFRIPDALSFEDTVLAGSSLPTGWDGAKRGHIEPGDVVAIIGAGAIGLCTLACANLYGPAQVVVSDLLDARLDLADEMGADRTVDASETDPLETLGELNGGHGPDVVVEAGGFEETYDLALRAVRPGGTVSIIAYHDDTYEMPFDAVWSRNLTAEWGYLDGVDVPKALALVESGRLDLDPVLGERVALSGVEGFDQLESPESPKVVIDTQR